MAGDERSTLNRDDLFLLMEAYRNNVELSTTLLEQQKQIIDQLRAVANTQQIIVTQNQQTAKQIDSYVKEIGNFYIEMQKNRAEAVGMLTKEHGTIISRVHLLYVGIGALLVPIVGFAVQSLEKLKLIHDIADYLGVG